MCWSVLVRSAVLTGSLCEFMDVCVLPRVSLNRLRYIREFSAEDGVLARWGFSAQASRHTRNIASAELFHICCFCPSCFSPPAFLRLLLYLSAHSRPNVR